MMATLDPVANFAKVTMLQGYGAAATSIAVEPSDRNLSKLPDPATAGEYNVVYWNSTTYPDPADDPYAEIVRVTAKNVNLLTVTRAQEGTSATDKNASGCIYKLVLAPTKKFRDDLEGAAVDVGTKYGWVTEYGAVGDGSTDDRTAFYNAAAAFSHLVIPYGTWRIASDITFSSTTTLEFLQGATLSIDTGKAVTINGTVLAGKWAWHSGSGSVVWGAGSALNNCTIVESSAIDVSSTGVKTCEIAHGLGSAPTAKQITLTLYRSSGSNNAVIRSLVINAIDATNITLYFDVFSSAATTEYKVVARIYH